jgi:DNA-binding Lrp family transcriptional regulator
MIDLDRTDCEILALLRNDARLSNKALAGAVGLAPSTCLLRVRRLIREGVLKGFHADVDPGAVGATLQAMIAIRLERHSRAEVEAFRAHALAQPEVVQLYHVAGVNDFLAHVWVRDARHLRDVAMTAFTARAEVAHIETGLIFEHAVSDTLPMLRETSRA